MQLSSPVSQQLILFRFIIGRSEIVCLLMMNIFSRWQYCL